jgi:flavin-binding protein dodecin
MRNGWERHEAHDGWMRDRDGGMRDGGMRGDRGMREGGMMREREERERMMLRERDDHRGAPGWYASGGGGGAMNDRGFERDRMHDDRERGMRPRGDDDRSMENEAGIVKVIEVVAQSPHSWEDAARRALAEASRTIRDIKSIYVKDMQAVVSHERIVEFRLVAKISFAVRDRARERERRDYA